MQYIEQFIAGPHNVDNTNYTYYKYNLFPYYISKFNNRVNKKTNIHIFRYVIREISQEEFLEKTNISKNNLIVLENLLESEDQDNWTIAIELYKSLMK